MHPRFWEGGFPVSLEWCRLPLQLSSSAHILARQPHLLEFYMLLSFFLFLAGMLFFFLNGISIYRMHGWIFSPRVKLNYFLPSNLIGLALPRFLCLYHYNISRYMWIYTKLSQLIWKVLHMTMACTYTVGILLFYAITHTDMLFKQA
jgi:hypothetical protein